MKRLSLVLLSTSLLLVACNKAPTAQVTGSDSSASSVMEKKAGFTGTHTEVDMEKSSVTFVGQSSIINHPGRFESFTVKLTPDGAEPHDFTKATLIVTIDTASAKTDAAMLDGHLQKPEFFDSATYPEATFVSMSITHKTGNKYAVTGDLTIKNITKEVAMNVEVNDDKLTLDYEIPRADFEIGKDSYGDKILTATVPLKAEIVFVK